MHVGLIGGIGPAATDFYYRRLISIFQRENAALELTIVHADTPTLLGNLERNDVAAQIAIYVRLTERLANAGAECVAVTSIAGHFCIEAFKVISPLPVIDMIHEVDQAVMLRYFKCIGILGTRIVMQSRFYGGVSNVDVIAPSGDALNDVHRAYVTMATSGSVTPSQRAVFTSAGKALIDAGAEAIMLGGTDLALVFDAQTTEFPVIDCAGFHAEAIAKWALPTT